MKVLIWVGSFLLTGKSLLLTVNWLDLFYLRFGLFCLRWKLGWVFSTYGSPPLRKLGLVFFYLQVPPSGNWVWSFLLTVPPR